MTNKEKILKLGESYLGLYENTVVLETVGDYEMVKINHKILEGIYNDIQTRYRDTKKIGVHVTTPKI